MQAVQICKGIKKIFDKEEALHGEVHSVHARALNILLENNELITVLSNEKTIGPNSILLDNRINFHELGIIQGLDIVISDKKITIYNLNISVEIATAKPWDPAPQYSYSKGIETDIIEKLKLMEELILEHGKLEGIGPVLFNLGKINEGYKLLNNINADMNQYSIFIINRLEKFLNSVSSNDIERASESVKQIVGFGPGLTPSMDDLISGLMLSFVYLSNHYALDKNKILQLNESIALKALNKTTRVSEEMLKHSSIGEATEAKRDFIVSMLSDDSIKDFTDKLMKVIEFGDTSGTDTLCGIYFGFRILLSEKNKEVYANGSQC